ncbi:hypothetical protein [Clostridium saccharobutylicum]|uniref:Spo0E like sporulation regulatory protein n=1 Tax=Clostridium saccharobutylicum TaxID=169679 RepID=A0A1S8NE02_CLOSA|nr:hypothetical protein [Clostridium saccharobutylicum]OOM14638.1 hypothetical protein CLOSAC_15180 [Clostridium saccharobutylicum]
MNNAKYEKELEDLREKLNKDVVKYIEHRSKEEYKDLLTKSRELDEAIVKHIKSLKK